MSLPGLDELLALRGAAQGLSLRARTPARAQALGAHPSTYRGRGLEFQEVRPYVAGDDPRSIDWRVTARRGRPHTKLFREERERPVWLLVDLHAGLYFGTRRQLKSALMLRAAALLAWTTVLDGDRIAAVIAGAGGNRVLPPRSRDAGVLPLLAALVDMQPRAPAPRVENGLQAALRLLSPLVRPGSLVLALSDFASLDTCDEALWLAVAAHSECRLFWITDPLEEAALPNGRFRAGLPGLVRILDGAGVRAHWRQSWQAREARLGSLARLIAAPLSRLDTPNSVEDMLRPLLPRRGSVA